MTPNPGSKDASAQGCTCPVMDNNHGLGFIVAGKRSFWMNDKCPLHGSNMVVGAGSGDRS